MSHHAARVKRYSLEAVPNNHGQFEAVFRVHSDGALPADDEIHFGEISDTPMGAIDEARRLAKAFLEGMAGHGPVLDGVRP